CSAAMRRTSGDDFVRTRSSNDAPPPLDWTGEGGALGGGADGAGADGAAAATGAAAFAGAGAPAGAAAGTAALTSVSRRATTVCTATVWPSVTRISANTPLVGAGISASTLSVEISKIGSSRLTVSPTFLSHFERVPSAIDSPIWGITTSTRATALPSIRVHRPATSASKQPDRYERYDHKADPCSPRPVLGPAARCAGFLVRYAASQRPDDLRNQDGDHPATEQTGDRRKTADSKILPLSGRCLPRVSRRPAADVALPVRGHWYAATVRAARTMSAVCGSTKSSSDGAYGRGTS